VRLIRLAGAATALAALAVAGSGAVGVSGAGAAETLPVPTLSAPFDGAVVNEPPVFSWEPAPGIDRYDFQLAVDADFTTPVTGVTTPFRTRNIRATIKKTLANGTYWWRVRSVNAAGDVSTWSSTRSVEHRWSTAPGLVVPAEGADVAYPSALVFEWTAVPRARTYVVSVARDAAFASPVGSHETDATSLAYPTLLTPGTTYYWRVTPLDGGRHAGEPSAVGSFRWVWPSTTASTPGVQDLTDAYAQVFDPKFSWDPVPGAVRYQLEMWSSDQPDLKVCCSGTSIGTSLVPTGALNDNTYFWRVRGLDPAGEAGAWNSGPSFTKAFGRSAVENLRMRDNVNDPGTDVDPATSGYQTHVPIVRWDPFPGASSYQVEVTPYVSDRCNWTAPTSHWTSVTATTAWTPLGSGWNGRKPYDDARNVATDSPALVAGTSYCVRIRPRDLDAGGTTAVYGDYTEVNPGGPAFQWVGYPAGEEDCTPWPSCTDGYLRTDSYLGPARGVTTPRMPLFTWRPIAGNQSYFVLVAKDPSFHTIVDYAFTQVPAYAPRGGFTATTYQDETTDYYWAVLPAVELNGNLASGNPLAARAADFQKLSTAPTLLGPANAAVVAEPPTFQWAPVEAARRYRLEVSDDPTFTTLLESATTNATGFTSNTTYPSDAVVYWRVRGEDEAANAMTWSATRTLRRPLSAPVPSGANPVAGDFVPTVRWGSVQGALSYDVDIVQTNGTTPPLTSRAPTGYTPSSIVGAGVWKWRVRARFPTSGQAIQGPITEYALFTRALPAPAGAATNATGRHVLLTWQPDDGGNGVKEYRVQTSSRADFSTQIENELTENAGFAPTLTHALYTPGLTVYWRVAAVDGGSTTGLFTSSQTFTVPATATPPSPPPPPPAPPAPPPPPPPPPAPPPPPPPPFAPPPPPPLLPPPPASPPPPPVAPPPAPPPASRVATKTTMALTKTRRSVRLRGKVTPPPEGGKVVTTLYRKRGAAFVRVASKTTALTTTGTFVTTFPRPRQGMYRVTVRYRGDAALFPSQASATFRA
jgi:large repetitive protein